MNNTCNSIPQLLINKSFVLSHKKKSLGLFGFIFLITQFSSLNFHHSSLITHNSSLNFSHRFGIITHFPSLNIFHTICGPIPVSRYNLFSFFFSLSVPKLTEANIKKIIKKKILKKPQNGRPNQRKKKSQSGQKLRLVLFAGPSCVFNYKNVIEL